MTTLQIRNNLKKYIDIADVESIKRIQSFIEVEKDCTDYLTDEQLIMLDESITEADKGLGISHEKVMKEIKKKWLVK